MSETTNIEWCDATVNFWWGCKKVSPGCAHCYADTLSKRWGKDVWGPGKPREDHLSGAVKLAMKLDRQAAREGRRLRVFSNSMSDWLDDEIPIEWLATMLDTIRKTQNLDWLLLTKRPENWRDRMEEVSNYLGEQCWADDEPSQLYQWQGEWCDGKPPTNVWIGTTAEDQARADERIPLLLDIPAQVRFLSCEPLLEPLRLTAMAIEPSDPLFLYWPLTGHHIRDGMNEPACFDGAQRIHWLITGGESGAKSRHFSADWARDLRDQCAAAGTAFFMKQMGGNRKPFPAIPQDLMIRQFPGGKEGM